MRKTWLGVVTLLVACGEAASKDNPCPQGICIGTPGGAGADGGSILPPAGTAAAGLPGSGERGGVGGRAAVFASCTAGG